MLLIIIPLRNVASFEKGRLYQSRFLICINNEFSVETKIDSNSNGILEG